MRATSVEKRRGLRATCPKQPTTPITASWRFALGTHQRPAPDQAASPGQTDSYRIRDKTVGLFAVRSRPPKWTFEAGTIISPFPDRCGKTQGLLPFRWVGAWKYTSQGSPFQAPKVPISWRPSPQGQIPDRAIETSRHGTGLVVLVDKTFQRFVSLGAEQRPPVLTNRCCLSA